MKTPFHAVAYIDHHKAQVLRFDSHHLETQRVKAHDHYTRQHGSAVRTEHEFFGEVCDALALISDVLVVGSHTAQADYRHYLEKHRPALAAHVVGWETVDHPTEGQLLAIGRAFFAQRDAKAVRSTT